ncbi:MAG: methionine--tRNA ligase [Nanoarchaeota archaeon]|nr:methionine--tRNA ligase [Nanoarchaeota archaeon]
MSKRKKFYITTAIDYPSAKPHMGHCYEKVCADVLARWFRLSLGKSNVFFQTGLDEHGLKIQRKAEESGLKPKAYVDMMSQFFLDLAESYDISYDNFIRTTDKKHIKFCKEILQKVFDKGDIYEGVYEGLYCVDCETYYTENDLVDGKCPIHNKKCEHLKEESYFFRMGKYQKKIMEHIEKGYILPAYRKSQILSRMKEGVRDLCISRSSFDWGVPLPFDKKQYAYVWFDALLNYASGAKKEFWPTDLHLIGHDILWHHSVIWLSMLASAGLKLPKNVFVHGFINAEGGIKMSKSLGNVLDPMELIQKYPSDSIRYFLIREIPFGNDGAFSEKALVSRHNNELANDLGNLLQRTTVMIKKYFNQKIPKKTKDELFKKLQLKKIEDYMEKYEMHNALAELWKFINECNKYINETKPWELFKKDKGKLGTVIYNLADALRNIAILLKPFLPSASQKIAKALNIKNFDRITLKNVKFGQTKENKINDPKILFKKIEFEEKKKEEEEMVDFEYWSKLKLKVGKIIEAANHPKADNLYVLKVDLGGEKRQLVAGISKHYSLKELKGKKIIVIANLKPAKIRGVESNGMLLAAEDGKGHVKLLTTDGDINPGAKVE